MAQAQPKAVNRTEQVKTVEEILKQTIGAVGAAGTTAQALVGSTITPETGSYVLKVVYYLLMYALIIFVVLLLVHFTLTPIFRLSPGGKGYIGVPGVRTGNKVYWNEKGQPPFADKVPKVNDDLDQYDFLNDFSFSVDLLIRRVPQTDQNKRLIMFMSDRTLSTEGANKAPIFTAPTDASGTIPAQQLGDYLGNAESTAITGVFNKASMAMYLDEANNLIISFYTQQQGTAGAWYDAKIKNIPLYTPFRIGVIVEKRIFTVYLNNQQSFQRVVPKDLGLKRTNPQRFYFAPQWAQQPRQTSFVQNLIVWDRVIMYEELKSAQPALASVPDFDAPPEPETSTC